MAFVLVDIEMSVVGAELARVWSVCYFCVNFIFLIKYPNLRFILSTSASFDQLQY